MFFNGEREIRNKRWDRRKERKKERDPREKEPAVLPQTHKKKKSLSWLCAPYLMCNAIPLLIFLVLFLLHFQFFFLNFPFLSPKSSLFCARFLMAWNSHLSHFIFSKVVGPPIEVRLVHRSPTFLLLLSPENYKKVLIAFEVGILEFHVRTKTQFLLLLLLSFFIITIIKLLN